MAKAEERRIFAQIKKDLAKKMVFISGPRQCGKTTLAKPLLQHASSQYYNWDIDRDRMLIQKNQLDASSKLWILDEIHKYPKWRNWLKGNYDDHHENHSFLVTGSARLDVYSRGGDSLQGRYFPHHLHPFTLGELLKTKLQNFSATKIALDLSISKQSQTILEELFQLSGFPEPFLSSSQKEANRWSIAHRARIVREEIRDLENIKDLSRMELLLDHLPRTVGSVLSINSLREDLEVAFETVRHWLLILENLFACFRIAPWGPAKLKAVKKEQKLYLWNWTDVESPGARFENMVACHLIRWKDWLQDVEGIKIDIRYFRDVNNHEVDFIIMRSGKPWMAIEVKSKDEGLDPNLKYLLQRLSIPYAFQISYEGTKDWEPSSINGCKIRIMPTSRFLAHLP